MTARLRASSAKERLFPLDLSLIIAKISKIYFNIVSILNDKIGKCNVSIDWFVLCAIHDELRVRE